MAYTKRSDVPVQPGELAVELDTGALVAAACERKRVDGGICYAATARAIDEMGSTVLDARGRGLVTHFKHVAPVSQIEALGDDVIARECLFAVLGEPLTLASGVPLIPWSDPALSGASIRVSLTAAPLAGMADANSLL